MDKRLSVVAAVAALLIIALPVFAIITGPIFPGKGAGALTGCDAERKQSCLDALSACQDQLNRPKGPNSKWWGNVQRLVSACSDQEVSSIGQLQGACINPEFACGLTTKKCVQFQHENALNGPDLVVSQLCADPPSIVTGSPSVSCGTGVHTKFEITIKNVGDTATQIQSGHGLHGLLTLTQQFGSNTPGTTFLILESFFPPLNPGQTFNSTFNGCINVNHPILSASVDVHNQIIETNEVNNAASIAT